MDGGVLPQIRCADGFCISVQAGNSMYCTPRDNEGPWTQVECGYPSLPPEFISEYAESPDSPCETVYGYVPVELVEKLIDLHNGDLDE